jgi:hypothetical protein
LDTAPEHFSFDFQDLLFTRIPEAGPEARMP